MRFRQPPRSLEDVEQKAPVGKPHLAREGLVGIPGIFPLLFLVAALEIESVIDIIEYVRHIPKLIKSPGVFVVRMNAFRQIVLLDGNEIARQPEE
jgi:hypothetical protein